MKLVSLLFICITKLILLLLTTTTFMNSSIFAARLPYGAPQHYDDSEYISYDEFLQNSRKENLNYRRDTSASLKQPKISLHVGLKEPVKAFKDHQKPKRQELNKQINFLENSIADIQRMGRANLGCPPDLCPVKSTPENIEQLTCLIQSMHEHTLAIIKDLGDLEVNLLASCKKAVKENEMKKKRPTTQKPCLEDDEMPDMCRDDGSRQPAEEMPCLHRFAKSQEPLKKMSSYRSASNEHNKNLISDTQGAIQSWETQLKDSRKLLNDYAMQKTKKATNFNTAQWVSNSNNNLNNHNNLPNNNNNNVGY